MAQQRPPRGGGGKAGGGGGGGIPTHPLVEALAPDPAQPPQRAARLFGYPGPSTDPNATRLYLDHDLSSYIEVPHDAIRHSQTLENDAGTIVWVDPSATVTHSTTQSHEVQADFLSGGIAQQHLGAAAAAGAGPAGAIFPTPTVQVTHFGPCLSDFVRCGWTRIPHCWQTETCPPSHFAPCVSVGFTCTYLPPCGVLTHTPPCQLLTHAPPCPSIGIACTVAPPCHVSGIIACSQLGCPSGPVCIQPGDPLSPVAR